MTTRDPARREADRRKYGVDFARAEEFEWEAALVDDDATEKRFRAIGPIGDILYVYIFTLEAEGTEDRAISLRRAEPEERRFYARAI